MAHILPHWNWKGREGEVTPVYVFTSGDEGELFLNGKSLGRSAKTSDCLHAQWLEVPFAPGKIEVVSYKDGREVARAERQTAGPAAGLRLNADRSVIAADGYDLSFITVEAVDAAGIPVPTADTMLHFSVVGCGELFGVDNGNAADILCLKGSDKQLFSGKALAVIRSLRGATGSATLTVSSEIGEATLTINTR